MKKLVLTLLILLALPGVAKAADTYVAPNGTGNACTQAAPCSILTGGIEADANSAIILAPGSYGSASDPIDDRIYTTAPNANYVGRADATIYVDSSSTDGSVAIYSGQKFLGYGTRIISSDLFGITIYGSGQIDRLKVRTSITESVACLLQNEGMLSGGRIQNSLCVADGFGSDGIYLRATRNDESAQVLASTGVAIGNGGVGIGVENTGLVPGGSGYSQLEVYLSIARAAAGYDLEAGYDNDDNQACMSSANTSVTSIRPNGCGVSGEGNVVGDPGFVAADSDFHLSAASPLVDAFGPLAYPVPKFDLDGELRDQASPEPGAYEFIRCLVPRLRGLKMPQVRRRLNAANCRLGRVTRRKVSIRRRAGRVLKQSPVAGRELPANARVAVTVARRTNARR